MQRKSPRKDLLPKLALGACDAEGHVRAGLKAEIAGGSVKSARICDWFCAAIKSLPPMEIGLVIGMLMLAKTIS